MSEPSLAEASHTIQVAAKLSAKKPTRFRVSVPTLAATGHPWEIPFHEAPAGAVIERGIAIRTDVVVAVTQLTENRVRASMPARPCER